jgi:hypothetical protein
MYLRLAESMYLSLQCKTPIDTMANQLYFETDVHVFGSVINSVINLFEH